jgi:hypothetical protein
MERLVPIRQTPVQLRFKIVPMQVSPSLPFAFPHRLNLLATNASNIAIAFHT